jgi:DNA-directed RNA polymerase II subunit RPB1
MPTDTYENNDEIGEIDSITFSIFGNTDIKKYSAIVDNKNGISIPDLYDNMEPKRGGLIDSRLGTTDNHISCGTCGFNSMICPGHFGHIELNEYVFHLGFLPYVKKILSLICLKCYNLLLDKKKYINDLERILKIKNKKNRLIEMKSLSKSISQCHHCGVPVSKIRVDIKKTSGQINVFSESITTSNNSESGEVEKKKIKLHLTPEHCFEILKGISDEDCIIMGLNPKESRPESMIIKTFAVPPVTVRPSTKADFLASSSMEDDLTHKLADIIKCNSRIKKYKESPSNNNAKYAPDHLHLLQYHIASFHDNESLNLPRAEQKGKPIKSLSSRLKGKEGRLRGNLMGKRVNFSARTVITPDPTLDINQLGVPLKIAKNLTFPEIVTPNNIKYLTKLVENGRDKYPGANFIFSKNSSSGSSIFPRDLRWTKGRNIQLKYGDIVERHLQTGDFVLLNRQPTLHKLSMMGHSIKVIDNDQLSTFRLNVAVTVPYNADFDGDEMNIFVPQSIQSMIELEEIADVKRQIVTPATSLPIIGVVQDGLLGSWNITRDNKIDKKTCMNILSYTDIELPDINKEYYTGNEVLSYLLPENINTVRRDENKNVTILVKNGVIKKGIFGKRLLGSMKKGSLIHLIWEEYGMNKTKEFIDNIQKLINNYNLYYGFSVGIGDIYIDSKNKNDNKILFNKKKINTDFNITNMENNPDMLDEEIFESSVFSELNAVLGSVSKSITKNLDDFNSFKVMSKDIGSGSKGSNINYAQMAGCVGQQGVEGSRIKKKINNRTLVYFPRDNDSAISRGFIEEGYLEGLSPISFIFHNMSSREGIIDTAIKTAESGYIQRKLIKSMEDCIVMYDGTVRNARNTIIQFVYGDNGINTISQSSHSLKIIRMNNDEIKNLCYFNSKELKKIKSFKEVDNKKYYNYILNLRDFIRKIHTKCYIDNKTINDNFMLPVNLYRIIDKRKHNNSKNTLNDPNYIIKKINSVIEYENTKLLCLNKKDINNKESYKYQDELESKTIFKIFLHEFLCPKKVILDYKLNKQDFDNIINDIINEYNNSVVDPGETVGIIAAQTLGEPVTQMTLNTFHHAGIASMGTSNLGVGRTREILSLSKKPKEPIMKIYLEDEYRTDDKDGNNKLIASKISSVLKYTTIGMLVDELSIYYDPNPLDKNGFMENDNVFNIFFSHNNSNKACNGDINNTPWLIRIVLDKEKMVELGVGLLDIKSKFCSNWIHRHKKLSSVRKEQRVLLEKISKCTILSNSNNDDTPIIHIRLNMNEFNYETLIAFQEIIIYKYKLKGIKNVTNIRGISSERCLVFNEKNGNVDTINENIIYTDGINLIDIRYIKGINLKNTLCNNIVNIYHTFGIEAARNSISIELQKVYRAAGNDVNFQHISVLLDIMTYSGIVISIDRFGINKLDTDPLSKASFEKTVDQLLTAAVFNETDTMNSVSSRIMAGMIIKGGTGICNVLLDHELLEKSEYKETMYMNENINIEKNNIITDVIGKEDEDIDSFFPI